MKKIGIDTSPLKSGHAIRGVGFYIKRILPELIKQSKAEGLEVSENLAGSDLIHYPYFDLFRRTLPQKHSVKTVVTIHDVIPLEFPKHYPPGVKGWVNLQFQKQALSGVNSVITDSLASRKAIVKHLGVNEAKVEVIYLAADKIFRPIMDKRVLDRVRKKYHLPATFVLYVGDVNWNKNIPNLILACKGAKLALVIVGKHARDIDQMDLSHPELRHLKDLDWNSVSRLGFVPDADLVAIYNLAKVYCQSSFAEGFGLPVLEAMACGSAVACSRTHSLPEIGGSAVVYFDPYNVNEIEQALVRAKPGIGISQARKFSWEQTAKQTLSVYTKLI